MLMPFAVEGIALAAVLRIFNREELNFNMILMNGLVLAVTLFAVDMFLPQFGVAFRSGVGFSAGQAAVSGAAS